MEHAQRLLKEIRNGNDSAFTELIHPLIAKAYRTSYAILRSKDGAEETVQVAMIEAYRNIMEGKPIKKFDAWFNQLVASRSLDLARQRTRQRNKMVDLDTEWVEQGAESTSETVIAKETRTEVIEAIESLQNEDYRFVLIMYYFHDLSVAEIAKMLGSNPSTVKTHLRRAREVLGKQLNFRNHLGVI